MPHRYLHPPRLRLPVKAIAALALLVACSRTQPDPSPSKVDATVPRVDAGVAMDARTLPGGRDASPPTIDASVEDNSLTVSSRTAVYDTHGPKALPRRVWRVTDLASGQDLPVVVGSVVIRGFGFDPVFGSDVRSGTTLWTWKGQGERMPNGVFCSKQLGFIKPIVVEKVLYSVSCAGWVLALDPQSGRDLWRHFFPVRSRDVAELEMRSFPIVTRDLVLSTYRELIDGWRLGGRIVAVDRRSGTHRWAHRIEGGLLDWAVVGRRVLLAGSSGLQALDLDTGAQSWSVKERILEHELEPWQQLRVVGDEVQLVHGSSRQSWSLSTGRRLPVGPEIARSVSQGLAVRLEGSRLEVTEVKTGRPLWSRRITRNGWHEQYSVADGIVYFAEPSAILALDLRTGAVIWRFPLTSNLNTRPVPDGGALYFSTNGDGFWCLR